jgi:hypothetical protein
MSITVTAARYNALQQRIAAIMGTATNVAPTTGYGQIISSSPVTGSGNQSDLTTVNKVSSLDYRNLYLDLARARIHQIGANAFSQTAFPIGDFLTNLNADKVELAYVEALENLMTEIEVNKELFDLSTQGELLNLRTADNQNIQSVRTSSWGGAGQPQIIRHVFSLTFSSVAARRHFFNSGGQIRLEANLSYSGSEAKTIDWRNILSNMGTILFGANNTASSTGQGTGSNIGNYQLTSSNTQIFRIFGTAVYSSNSYRILARNPSATQIEFTVEFRDDDTGSGPVPGSNTNLDPSLNSIDEPVRGTLTSGPMRLARANGTAVINGVNTDTVVITQIPVGSPTAFNL